MDLKTHAKKLKITLLLAALMLCFAVFPALPYAFYLLLKWVVCGVAVESKSRRADNFCCINRQIVARLVPGFLKV